MKGCSSCNLMFSRNLIFSQNPNFKMLIGVQFFHFTVMYSALILSLDLRFLLTCFILLVS